MQFKVAVSGKLPVRDARSRGGVYAAFGILQAEERLKGKEKQVKTMEALLEEKEKEIVKKGEWLQGQKDTIAQLTSKVQELEQQNLQQLQQDVQKENESFKAQIQELKQENCKQASLAVQSEELLQV
ncbi:kinectin isoform x9 [Limosa lapponica baueri]|uniref:Kinectin isoform x9 n=1 Tax=Limosa lapponica baueri TaxID=1758121 RepID=A0A2I0T8U8_LIMLA|nr:kinectin isoform x9 [Limosa lapponica baueri]